MAEEKSENLYRLLTIQNISIEADGFKTFAFKEGHHLTYEAGQFLTLVQHNGAEEIRRSYSITSSPALNEPLSIGVKRVANGFFSRKLIDEARPGDFLYTIGAGGFFRLPENIQTFGTIFFFAAGSGITPEYALIKTTLHLYPGIRIFLIYSNQSEETTVFHQQLKKLSDQHPNLSVHFLFSSMADLRKAHLNRELLLEFLAISHFERDKTLFYVCGPAAYMRMIIYHLREQGFPVENIKKEDFDPKLSAFSKLKPPDTGTHQVRVQVSGHDYSFSVHYPDSILKAAQKEKILLPYSCETGKCGSCVMRCAEGEVWLSNNEVLTPKELSQGLTLTCVGHPVNGDVVLETGAF
jgi:ring-1,2-phenylacetyl-CoA epoxidase subunit PaaE